MKGDKIIVEEHHRQAAKKIIEKIIHLIQKTERTYVITVAGESGSGKSETAKAILEHLSTHNISAFIYGQDDYFVYPPKTNASKRKENFDWVGTNEVQIQLLDSHLAQNMKGAKTITKPLADYDADIIEEETVDLKDIKVVIAEGTYTSLLKHVDTKIFINRNRLETLEARKKRNRGNEVQDPFVENILKLEHKIIEGHKHLADFIITNDYNVECKR